MPSPVAIRATLLAVLACAATGCGHGEGAVGPAAAKPSLSPLHDQIIAGVGAPAIQALLSDHFEWMLKRSPVWATSLGDHRYDRELGDRSLAAVAADLATMQALVARARALEDAAAPSDRVTLELLEGDLDADLAARRCKLELWNLNAMSNPLAELSTLPQDHAVKTLVDADNLLARYHAIPRLIDQAIEELRAGAAAGLYANAESVQRTIAMVDRELAKPTAEWGLAEVGKHLGEHGFAAADVDRLGQAFTAAIGDEVAPAVKRYRALLADELLPHARDAAHAGVGALPDGAACYAALIKLHTGTDQGAAELHQIGLDEIARTDREITELGAKLFGAGTSLADTLKHLRTDPALYFTSREEILAAAEAALAAARAKIPGYFGILPKTDCVVSEIPAYEAPYTTIAYYKEPHFDGSKPGEYFVNTYKPEVRPRFEMRVLAYHESIPGHHLQIAISQEQQALPAFRRFLGLTAFVEGWALYTERLADEMGLYETDLDHMGMLSFDAWRAARLVVDTGMHAQGWTRAQAEDYLRAHTALSDSNISNEVDRYLGDPGQALAYKVGQRFILALRAKAQAELGAAFDLRGFHDAVLENGAVSLPVLERSVDAWIASRKQPPAASSGLTPAR